MTRLTYTVVCLFLVSIFQNAAGERIAALNATSKYVLYYGFNWDQTTLDWLASFDFVVLHTERGAEPRHVAYIQSRGAIVIGYISIGEEENVGNPPLTGTGLTSFNFTTKETYTVPGPYASFYMDCVFNTTSWQYESDGLPDANPIFKGRYIYPNAEWRVVIKNRRLGGNPSYPDLPTHFAGLDQIVGKRHSDDDTNSSHNFGFDGFFLDTLDTAGPYEGVLGYFPFAAKEMSNTVRFIKETYPGKIVYANRGPFFFHPLVYSSKFNVRPYDYTIAPYIDAVLYESFYLDSNWANPNISPYYYDNSCDYIPKICVLSTLGAGFTIFTLDYSLNRPASYVQAAIQANAAFGVMNYASISDGIDVMSPATVYPIDNSPPAWSNSGNTMFNHSRCSNGPRVGVQSANLGSLWNEVVLKWDLAIDQTGPVRYNLLVSNPVGSCQPTTIVENIPFELTSNWASNPAQNVPYQYKWTAPSAGTYSFIIRAVDALGQAENNNVSVSITITAPLYNPVSSTSLQMDGDLSDWLANGLGTFTNPSASSIDYSVATDGTNVYFAAPSNNHQIFINTGASSAGFSSPSVPFGADWLIEGRTLYRYAGTDPNNPIWSWIFVVTTTAPTNSEMVFPLSAFSGTFLTTNPLVGFVYIDSAGVASAVRQYGTIIYSNLVQSNPNWACSVGNFMPFPGSPALAIAHDQSSYYFSVNQPATRILFDYQPGGFSHASVSFGVDAMWEANSFYIYTGTGSDWSWRFVATDPVPVTALPASVFNVSFVDSAWNQQFPAKPLMWKYRGPTTSAATTTSPTASTSAPATTVAPVSATPSPTNPDATAVATTTASPAIALAVQLQQNLVSLQTLLAQINQNLAQIVPLMGSSK